MTQPTAHFDVSGQVVAITGASRGIGRELALAFGAAGARIALGARSGAELERTAALVGAQGADAQAFELDLRVSGAAERFAEQVVARFGRIDVLINNAGAILNRPALEITEAEWDLLEETNLRGLFFCSRGAARAMAVQGGGRIINISSALASVAQHGYAAYGATKAAVNQLTRVLAFEWASIGVRVNAIAPTTTETAENRERLRTPEMQERARQRIPLGRFGTGDDLVGAALFLASPASAFITGQIIVIDGGLSLP